MPNDSVIDLHRDGAAKLVEIDLVKAFIVDALVVENFIDSAGDIAYSSQSRDHVAISDLALAQISRINII